ncbi:unnamed protein product, partial [Ascophyllum nodosum]
DSKEGYSPICFSLPCTTLHCFVYSTFSMAERTRDGGVEECKGFSPFNIPTTNASITRLPLGSLDLKTRVPNQHRRYSYSSKAKVNRATNFV